MARELYLANGGEISMSELSKQAGISRESLGKIRTEEKWDLELEMALALTKTKAIDAVSTDLESAFSRSLANLQKLDEQISKKLDADLSPNDINSLSRAMGTIVTTSRLLNGQSTSNTAVDARITSGIKRTSEIDNRFQQIMMFVAETGDAEAQSLLKQMIESRQKLIALMDDAGIVDV